MKQPVFQQESAKVDERIGEKEVVLYKYISGLILQFSYNVSKEKGILTYLTKYWQRIKY